MDCLHIENIDFYVLTYILLNLINLITSSSNCLGFFIRPSCHLWKGPVLYILSDLCAFYFNSSPDWFHSLTFQALCWIGVVRVDIFAFFPVFKGKHSVFHLWYDVSCGYFVDILLYIKLSKFPSVPSLLKVFIMNVCWIFSVTFLH